MPTRQLNHLELEPVEVGRAVRGQLGSATLAGWEAVHLGRGRGDNLTSLGVQRVHGRARTIDGDVGWTQIRKVFVRTPGDEEETGHWNYWRREPLLLASDVLAGLPRGVSAPSVYLIVDDPDRVIVWMEDAGDEPHVGWTAAQLGAMANRLGRLAGRFLDRAPTEPWLSRDLLGQWVAALQTYAPLLHKIDAPGWRDPRVLDVYRDGGSGPVATLLSVAPSIRAGLDRSTTTLCHRDCGLENLRMRGSELVLFDWALAGTGPVGEDLGLLLASAARLRADDPLVLGRQLLASYLDGLIEAAEPRRTEAVEAAVVWRTAVLSAALRETIFAAAHLSSALVEGGAHHDRFASFGADAPVIEALAAEALRLA